MPTKSELLKQNAELLEENEMLDEKLIDYMCWM